MSTAVVPFVPANRGHKAIERSRIFCRYTVYDNKTDFPILVDCTAEECARVLKRSRNSFFCLVNRVRKGKNKRYTILRRMVDEEDIEEEAS